MRVMKARVDGERMASPSNGNTFLTVLRASKAVPLWIIGVKSMGVLPNAAGGSWRMT